MRERTMVPEPEFESYYGRQIIKTPTWKTPDVPLYLFLGGMAGASAVLAEGAALTGNVAQLVETLPHEPLVSFGLHQVSAERLRQ